MDVAVTEASDPEQVILEGAVPRGPALVECRRQRTRLEVLTGEGAEHTVEVG